MRMCTRSISSCYVSIGKAGRFPSVCYQSYAFKHQRQCQCRIVAQTSCFTTISARNVVPSLSVATPLPSETRSIQNSLEKLKHDKWGWVIYRCTYDDDEAWSRFKRLINQRSRERIRDTDAPEAADSLEWTFIEDRSTLDGTSRDQLRARFKVWAPEAFQTEQPRAEHPRVEESRFYLATRYNYFIQVDEEALRSNSVASDLEMNGDGYVNFVDARWKPFSESHPDLDMGDDEIHESIDGCCEENVGWIRMASFMIGADFYFSAGCSDSWYLYYQRPPTIVDC